MNVRSPIPHGPAGLLTPRLRQSLGMQIDGAPCEACMTGRLVEDEGRVVCPSCGAHSAVEPAEAHG